MTETAKTSVELKVIAAAKVAGYVQKSSRNTGQSYNYAGDEAVSAKFREAMLAEGVLVYPSASEVVGLQIIDRVSKEGKHENVPYVLATVKRTFTVTDGITSFEVSALGQGMDIGDKAIPKALTGSKKYAYRELVMMVTGDDPEKPREDEKADRSTKAAVSSTMEQATAWASSQAPAEQVKGNPDSKITEAQKRLIRAQAHEVNLSDAALSTLRLRVTGKHSSKDMTNGDVDALLDAMKDPAQMAAAVSGGEVVPA